MVVIITALLLFSPTSWLAGLGMSDWVQTYRSWIGIAFIVSLTVSAVNRFCDAANWWTAQRRKRQQRVAKQARLARLTEGEKQILRYYIAMGTRSNFLRIDDGTVNALVHDGIIYPAAPFGSLTNGYAMNISDAAWDYIVANPGILEGETNSYRTDEKYR